MAFAFPPFALIPQVLVKLRVSGGGSDTHRPILATEGVLPGSSRSSAGASSQVGSSSTAARTEIPSASPRAKASCLETLQQFARASEFSSKVTERLGKARRASSLANYQSKWTVYRRWCADT